MTTTIQKMAFIVYAKCVESELVGKHDNNPVFKARTIEGYTLPIGDRENEA